MVINRVVIHHTGGTANQPYVSTQAMTAKEVDLVHKEKWNTVGSLGFFGGYNLYIDKYGKIKQFRAIGEETIAQKGYNYDSISICLAGNFSTGVDLPTFEQELTLKNLLIRLLNKNLEGLVVAPGGVDIKADIKDIMPHRALCPTTCYGSGLKDDWARNLVIGVYQEKITLLGILLEKLKTLFNRKQLGGVVPSSCINEDNRG